MPRTSLLILLPALLVAPLHLGAQESDSPLVPRGRLRIEVAPAVTGWDARYGLRTENGTVVEEEEPLGFDLTSPAAGTDLFPQANVLEDILRSALDDPDYRLNLGALSTYISRDQLRIPFRADVGVTDWLTVGFMVPVVKSRADVGISLVAGPDVNAGRSPLPTDPGVEAFLDGYGTALTTWQQRTSEICAGGESSPSCQDAQDFLDQAETFHAAVSGAYLVFGFLPLSGSAGGDALMTRLQELASGFQSRGVGGVPTTLPLAAEPLDRAGFQSLVTGFGTDAHHGLETWRGIWELGDVELSTAVRLLDGAVRDSAGAPARLRYQVGVGALLRLPTGRPDSASSFVDVGSGDGQTDIELRGFGQVVVGSRVGLAADVRYGIQQEGERVRRVSAPEHVLVPASREVELSWTPGNYLDAEVVPRFYLTPEFSIGLRYRYYSKDPDTYALSLEPSVDPDPLLEGAGALLGLETEETLQEVGVGMVFSTLDAWREGRTGLPFEVQAVYRHPIAGSGGMTPRATRIQVGLRLYWQIWGS